MKILVLSDSHGNYRNFKKVLEKQKEVQMIVHLGDGEEDMEDLEMEDAALKNKIKFVSGNCDFGLHKRSDVVCADGVRIFIAHGDRYSVKRGMDELVKAAKAENCAAAFFGHTHIKFCKTIDGVFVMNPGSCDMQGDDSQPSYAIVTVEDGKLSALYYDIW